VNAYAKMQARAEINITGFGRGPAMLVSAGLATFAHPYTGRRNYEQIATFEKMWEVSESAGWSFDVLAGNLRGSRSSMPTADGSPRR
jgi:hypothetical protein